MASLNKSIHLIIFVHGFQGNAFDLLLMCSRKNEDHTDEDISGMGERLSKEIEQFIEEWCPNALFEKISFVGHSLGGLIIRAALPYLEHYSSKFQFFITFSTPHLGCVLNSSALVDAGM